MPEATSTVAPLAGFTVGVTAERRREELGTALERRGATVVYGPAIRVVALADDSQALAATERCLSRAIDYTVVTTGVGFRGWMDAAGSWGLADQLHAALEASTILARGPKVRGAVRAGDLREAWSPESESSSEVGEYMLAHCALDGARVAVQLHGDPLSELIGSLRDAGAEVIEIPVYRWTAPEDEAPLHRLVALTADGMIDAVTFTSAPAAVNFLRTADELGLGDDVRAALRGPVLAAAVGNVTAGPLVAAGLPVVQPQRFRLGALVREVVEQLPARALIIQARGHRIEVRGSAAVIDDTLVPLGPDDVAVLRLLAARPGTVSSRDALAAAVPGGGHDGQAVELVMTRLRSALGDPMVVQTVGKSGYRIAGQIISAGGS